MSLIDQLNSRSTKLSLVGLGYVGMPIAIEFAKHFDVIGFDINSNKIKKYLRGIDPTNEVGSDAIKTSTVQFTDDPERLSEALFHIVAVPTPINQDKTPNLQPVIGASKTLGKYLKRGSIVVYESTVYPGITENVCAKILEEESGLTCGTDFLIGYSPERINPGDRIHTLTKIQKIVSGVNKEALTEIKAVYDTIIEAGTYPVSNIKTAEAIKVVENSQRDVNIAFMNELAMVFDRMGIDTNEVVDGMNTKWNALGFRPGLVGGHCIGVDPYYFIYEAENLGYHSQLILTGRQINDGMGRFVADATIKEIILSGANPSTCKVGILGLTFKENCPDLRNSKVVDIIQRLVDYGISVAVYDPWADSDEAKALYNVSLSTWKEFTELDCVIVAVAHDEYKAFGQADYAHMFGAGTQGGKTIIDVKGIVSQELVEAFGCRYWDL